MTARERLSNRRACESFEIFHSGVHFTVATGRYRDGRVAEIFLSAERAGTPLEAIARDAAILASLAFQHGVALETIRAALTRDHDGGPATARRTEGQPMTQAPHDMAAEARSVRLESEIARRGIKLSAGTKREPAGPCPVCGGTDRFSINLKKQRWYCRKCPASGDVIALVQHLDGIGFLDAIAYLAEADPQRTDCSSRKQLTTTPKQREDNPTDDTQPRGLALWRASIDPRRTIAERYLKSRALELPEEAASEAIRFHPACPFGSERFPAMVYLVRNIRTNEPQAIHRTALAADGTAIKRNGKTFRMSLGPIGGGAIKLDPDEDVTQGLCIGEGVETCLSGRQMGLRPVWSAVSTGGVKSFPVLPGIDGLTLFKENDPGGKSAEDVETCARRWYDAGRNVVIVEPDTANDLNDELREAAR